MSKNNKILKISLALVIVSALISIAVVMKLKVKKPVFFENFIEVQTSGYEGKYSLDENAFNIKYITNIDDNRNVVGITFKEFPEGNFLVGENNDVENYGRYAVHTLNITSFDIDFKENIDEIILTEADVLFSDGSNLTVDLGKIAICKSQDSPADLERFNSTFSSEGECVVSVKTNEDVTIEKVETPFTDVMSKFNYSINNVSGIHNFDEDIKGKSFKKDTYVEFLSEYKESDDIIENYTRYSFRPKVYFVNKYNDRYSGKYFTMKNENIQYSYYGLYKYLKARGEL
ncbi:MAG: hypothetical protein PUE01_10885 [Clostridiaceae bacterium]|nr:hypothetical protein [Clostridiaceae bacterium]